MVTNLFPWKAVPETSAAPGRKRTGPSPQPDRGDQVQGPRTRFAIIIIIIISMIRIMIIIIITYYVVVFIVVSITISTT